MYLIPDHRDFLDDCFQVAKETSSFHVSETLLEQGSGHVNEDALYADDRRCVVCDGATSLGGNDATAHLLNTSGGQRAATITTEVFSANRDLLDSARIANEMIREQMIESRIDFSRRESLWSTSFAAVDISETALNWCQIGDCMILVIYDDGTSKRLTYVPGQDTQVLKTWQRIGAKSHGTIHQELADEIGEVRRTMNRTFGVLNGEEEAMAFISHGTIETEHISDILIFSDGMFPPSSNPEISFAEDTFVALYQKGGLRSVRDHIRSVQQQDPGCYHYPRFKMFDDISAIALKQPA